MHPLLHVSLGFAALDLHAYSLFLTLAAVTTAVGSWVMAKRSGLPWRWTALVLLMAVMAGLLGARLLHVMTHWAAYRTAPWRIYAFDFNGLALFGGLVAATFVGWAACRRAQIDPWRLADSVAIPLGLGIAIARIGCFLNGCCFGRMTTMPWGVTFPLFSEAHMYQLSRGAGFSLFSVMPVHPTQLYDAVAALGGTLAAWLIIKRRLPSGVAIAAFMAIYALSRLVIQPFRVVLPSEDTPIWLYPMLFLSVAVISMSTVWQRIRSSKAIA